MDEQVIQRLKDATVRSQQNRWASKQPIQKPLTSGQQPYIILSCSDSRVVPEFTFDTGLGELFVRRVAGNVLHTSTIASIEYAVTCLDTEVSLVMGHENCGAVAAAVNGEDNGDSLNHLLAQINPAIIAADADATINEIVKKNASSM